MKQSKTKTLVTAGILALLGVVTAEAQTVETFSPVLTAVPSLQITPDARAAGMGDLGTSTHMLSTGTRLSLLSSRAAREYHWAIPPGSPV